MVVPAGSSRGLSCVGPGFASTSLAFFSSRGAVHGSCTASLVRDTLHVACCILGGELWGCFDFGCGLQSGNKVVSAGVEMVVLGRLSSMGLAWFGVSLGIVASVGLSGSGLVIAALGWLVVSAGVHVDIPVRLSSVALA